MRRSADSLRRTRELHNPEDARLTSTWCILRYSPGGDGEYPVLLSGEAIRLCEILRSSRGGTLEEWKNG